MGSICGLVRLSKQAFLISLLSLVIIPFNLYAQDTEEKKKIDIDMRVPNQYEIAGIDVKGIRYLDDNVVIMLSGLNVGDRISIPGDDLGIAIKKLWKQGLAENIKINVTDKQGDKVWLEFVLTEKPRVNQLVFPGLKRTRMETLRDEIGVKRGEVVTNYLLSKIKNNVEKFYVQKGFLNVDVNIRQVEDTTVKNTVKLIIDIDPHKKVKIYEINVKGSD